MLYSHELERLRNIAWQRTGTCFEVSHPYLVKEFLVRCARLLHRYGMTSTNPLITPTAFFGNAFGIDAATETAIKAVAATAPNLLVRHAAQRHLAFCLAADANLDKPAELVSLYDPLMCLFAQGGSIDKHHHELIISGKGAVSLFNWQERFCTLSPAD